MRAAATVAAASLLACSSLVAIDDRCPRGQQRVDGHCVPTPSLVFVRCMDAVRARTIEHDRGRELAVGARVDTRSAQLQHERHDRERQAYEDLGSEDLALALEECRRQEDAERQGQIARAWEEAARAQEQAERARIDAVAARGEAHRLGTALRRLEAMRGAEAAQGEPLEPGDAAAPSEADAAAPWSSLPQAEALPSVDDAGDRAAVPTDRGAGDAVVDPAIAVEAPTAVCGPAGGC
ncbi:MAG: hypothetical protein K1X88_33845 [Nannocystaceae bacterium]|nr:hypothetical protein [Nannocystaceae bacterium]